MVTSLSLFTFLNSQSDTVFGAASTSNPELYYREP